MDKKTEFLFHYANINHLYAKYTRLLDDQSLDVWLQDFDTECTYKIGTQENLESDYALALVNCTGIDMLRDRVNGLRTGVFFRERSVRRFYSGLSIEERVIGEPVFCCRSSFFVLESLCGKPSQVLAAGICNDEVVIREDRYKFRKKHFIVDAAEIPGSITYPF
ncbi:ring-hydroxylating dioxygenase [Teredinibacter turnerae]|uniref:ring-hydroxylating dioxygenase n=1 Tax=Teredinibacter turnerae TaxID=2426 RepID=UPI00040FF98E|nr:ring-hydroxylating dioxygenase [Teredinibacter turnerae]